MKKTIYQLARNARRAALGKPGYNMYQYASEIAERQRKPHRNSLPRKQQRRLGLIPKV